jgi:hypothetical protein
LRFCFGGITSSLQCFIRNIFNNEQSDSLMLSKD